MSLRPKFEMFARGYLLKTPSSILNRLPIRSPHRLFHRSLPVFESKTSAHLQQSITNQTNFSTTLATHLLSNKFHNSNFVFSPLIIHAVLLNIAIGSKGRTLNRLLTFLKANTIDELDSIYSHLKTLLNGPIHGPGWGHEIYSDECLSLKPCSQHDLEDNKVYKAVFRQHYKSKGGVFEYLESSKVKEFDFHLLNGDNIHGPFMSSKQKQYVFKEYDGFKVLGIPTHLCQGTNNVTMYFFLPNAKDGIQSLIEKISSAPDFLDTHSPDERVEIEEVLIPKFQIFSKFEASHVLKKLGLVLPFSEKYGLSDMIDSLINENVYVSSIYHKSVIVLNEDDTQVEVSSASTRNQCSSMIEANVDFVADHPFLFVIRDNVTRVVFFMGQVIDPSVIIEKLDY